MIPLPKEPLLELASFYCATPVDQQCLARDIERAIRIRVKDALLLERAACSRIVRDAADLFCADLLRDRILAQIALRSSPKSLAKRGLHKNLIVNAARGSNLSRSTGIACSSEETPK